MRGCCRRSRLLFTIGEADRAAYQRLPEQPDSFWDDAEAWEAEPGGVLGATLRRSVGYEASVRA